MTPERNVSLAAQTSLRVGGAADFFLLAKTGEQIVMGLDWAAERDVPVRIIGGGSNLLVAEAGFAGLVIKTANTHASVAERYGEPIVEAEAGANLANLARRLAKQGFGGLEWAANVPGTVGGAVVNNAGAFGGETAQCVIAIEVIDAHGRRMQLKPDEMDYAYRDSLIKRRELGDVAVERVELRLQPSTPAQADGLVKHNNAQRMRSQPRILSAGSVFANPDGTYSGKLIEDAGLKRARVGGAEISEQHANFIVNPGGATARDVYSLMRQAQNTVYERTGIWLRPEIELFGRWATDEIAALRAPGVLSGG
jgi:UDP-N-acetylmuramate dehydrogenase